MCTCVLLCLFASHLPSSLHACLIPCWLSWLLPRLGACLHICLLVSQLAWLIDCLTASFTPHLPSCLLYYCLFAHFCAFVLVRLFTCLSVYLLACFFNFLRVCFTLLTCSLSALPLPCQLACFIMNLLTCLMFSSLPEYVLACPITRLPYIGATLSACLIYSLLAYLASRFLCLLTLFDCFQACLLPCFVFIPAPSFLARFLARFLSCMGA